MGLRKRFDLQPGSSRGQNLRPGQEIMPAAPPQTRKTQEGTVFLPPGSTRAVNTIPHSPATQRHSPTVPLELDTLMRRPNPPPSASAPALSPPVRRLQAAMI